jgi:hypothetical protein
LVVKAVAVAAPEIVGVKGVPDIVIEVICDVPVEATDAEEFELVFDVIIHLKNKVDWFEQTEGKEDPLTYTLQLVDIIEYESEASTQLILSVEYCTLKSLGPVPDDRQVLVKVKFE